MLKNRLGLINVDIWLFLNILYFFIAYNDDKVFISRCDDCEGYVLQNVSYSYILTQLARDEEARI